MILTKRKTETEKERFSGFATRQDRRSYFQRQPQEKRADARAQAIEEIEDFEPLPVLGFSNEDEHVFEIEKEYNNFVPAVQDKGAEIKELPTFSIPLSEMQAKTNTKVRLNTRGKILAVVYSVIVALLFSFVIYNAVTIAGERSAVASIGRQVELRQSEIDFLKAEYFALGSEEGVRDTLSDSNSELKDSTEEDVVSLNLGQEQIRQKASRPTNWFDRICEFFSGIF